MATRINYDYAPRKEKFFGILRKRDQIERENTREQDHEIRLIVRSQSGSKYFESENR